MKKKKVDGFVFHDMMFISTHDSPFIIFLQQMKIMMMINIK